MNLAYDRFRLHAYVDGELTADEVADFERLLAADPEALAEVAALRAQNNAMHARYDALLSTATTDRRTPAPWRRWSLPVAFEPMRWAMAATVVLAGTLGLGAGWLARGSADARSVTAASATASTSGDRAAEGRLQAFVRVASLSHAVFVPEVRHPVEVAAADEAHLVAWLSKRLDAPLLVPHLGDAGWDLLGGRLLPAQGGPVAQFMYQDRAARRLTLAVSKGIAARSDGRAEPASVAFRIAEEDGNTVFYWVDRDYAYALTGKLTRDEMTALASRVHRQLDR